VCTEEVEDFELDAGLDLHDMHDMRRRISPLGRTGAGNLKHRAKERADREEYARTPHTVSLASPLL
jgi:hypothetical protein